MQSVAPDPDFRKPIRLFPPVLCSLPCETAGKLSPGRGFLFLFPGYPISRVPLYKITRGPPRSAAHGRPGRSPHVEYRKRGSAFFPSYPDLPPAEFRHGAGSPLLTFRDLCGDSLSFGRFGFSRKKLTGDSRRRRRIWYLRSRGIHGVAAPVN